MASARVAVVGAGLSGAACAQALGERGIGVEIFERGRGPGGRMASPTLHGRRVDMGAAYFTVKDPAFATVTDGWVRRGLAHRWTDTFDVVSSEGRDVTTGPMRFATSGGLRSLVREAASNVIKHARATTVRVAIRLDDHHLWVEVEDNGCGLRPETSPAGNGLANLRARMASLGGRFDVREVGQGVCLSAAFPLPGRKGQRVGPAAVASS